MTPWLDDGDVRLFHGDALNVLMELPDGSVDCVVTSPPYWGLRDYGTGHWDGGNPDCDHLVREDARIESSTLGGGKSTTGHQREGFKESCPRCGATRVDQQMGLEPTPDLFVQNMVAVFREIRRVLADHGTCWVNLGDAFQEKQLVGAPWRVAFALQADGWYLRSDIVWAKSNPMPESVTDRPTKSHEYIFMLTKSPRYFFDQEAVREPHTPDGRKDTTVQGGNGSIQHRDGERWPNAGRNIRSVWNIATQPYPEAHFATFPEELARRCILAGCPIRVCRVCGKPSERIVERGVPSRQVDPSAIDRYGNGDAGVHRKVGGQYQKWLDENPVQTVGWSDCGHNNWRPGVVLDPFVGSGTVAKVARDHGRHAIGIDLNEQYLELAAKRLQQLSLLNA